jgi:hypothetical protein
MSSHHGRRHRKRRRNKFDVAPTPITPSIPVTAPADTSASHASNNNDDDHHGGRDDC